MTEIQIPKIACDLVNKSGKTIKMHFSIQTEEMPELIIMKNEERISVFEGPNGTYQTIAFVSIDDGEEEKK